LNSFLDKEIPLKPGEQQNVTVWETLTLLISNVSCPCFAGSRVGFNQDLIVGMASFTQKIIKASVFLSVLPDSIGRFLVRNVFSVEREMDLIMDLLVPELEKIRSGEAGDDYELSFASLVLELPKENGQQRTVEEAAYFFNGIALASIHTTSHFSAFALHELAAQPQLCDDLRAEIATLGKDRTPETVAKLPLFDSFVREILRFNVDFLGMHHLALKDSTVSSGHVIPKGSLVVCAMDQVHRDPRFLPVDEETGEVVMGDTSLEVFDAYRFVGKKMKSTTTGSEHLTFGFGTHACPGRYLAANEIKYIVSELLVRYNLRTKSGKRAKDNVLLGMTRFAPLEQVIFEGR
jgi:cytochrome P450